HRDDELALRGGERSALRRGPSPAATARLTPIGLAVGFPRARRRRGRLARRCSSVSRLVAESRGRRRLLPAAPSASPAAAPLLRAGRCVVRRRLRRHVLCVTLRVRVLCEQTFCDHTLCRRCFYLRDGAVLRRQFFLLLAEAKPA